MKSEYNKHKNNLPAAQLGIVLKNLAAGIFMIGMILPITQVEALAQDILWTRQFGTSDAEGAKGITADSSGIYVAGSTNGTLPGQVSAGYDDAFVRKYDVNGDELWTRQFGSSSTYPYAFDYAHAITADSSGIYVAGDAGGTLPSQTSAGGVDAFVRKYDAGGNELWTRQFGSSSIYLDDTDHAYAITAVSSGIYIAGSAGGTLPGQTGAESRDAFVRKYDADGVELWTRQFGNAYRDVKGFPYTDAAYAITADSSGIYVAGRAASFRPDWAPTVQYGYDAFVRRYDVDGNEIWARQFSTSGYYWEEARGIAAAPSGIYVTGNANDEAFVRKFDANGNELWTRRLFITGDYFVKAYGITADPSGIYIAGSAYGTLPGQAWVGYVDAFVRKYDADGNELWTRQFGTAYNDFAHAITAGPSGNYVVGSTNSALSGQTYLGISDAYISRIGFIEVPHAGRAVHMGSLVPLLLGND